MKQECTTTRPSTSATITPEALYIETADDLLIRFRQDLDLAPDDHTFGELSVVVVEMPTGDPRPLDTLKVDAADGNNLEAVRRALEVLTAVEQQLDIIERRNRGLGPRTPQAN